jgi:hypothetical protein
MAEFWLHPVSSEEISLGLITGNLCASSRDLWAGGSAARGSEPILRTIRKPPPTSEPRTSSSVENWELNWSRFRASRQHSIGLARTKPLSWLDSQPRRMSRMNIENRQEAA